MRIEAFSAIVERLTRNLSYPGVAQELADALVQDAGAAACRIWVSAPGDRCHLCPLAGECQDRSTCLHLAGRSGCDVGADGAHLRYPIGARAVGQVASSRAPLLCHQPGVDHRLSDTAALAAARIRCCTVWPLVSEGATLGVLAIYAREPMSDPDLQQVSLLARRCAPIIANALATENLHRQVAALQQHNQHLARELLSARHHEQILGNSAPVRELRERIAFLATRSDPVLICGPAGSGKELAARALHAHGASRACPFVRIDCRTAPAGFIESELFGQECAKDARSPATRAGLLEVVDHGVLFLKQVHCLPESLGDRILQAVRSGRACRIGADAAYPVRVRLIGSCNEFGDGAGALMRFLGQVLVNVPALRQRGSDFTLLLEHNLRRFARLHNRQVIGPTPPEIERLQACDWPGNVRELVHFCERVVLLSDEARARFDWQPRTGQEGLGTVTAELSLEQMERAHIVRVLKLTRGVIQGPGGAAAILGLRPSSLRSRMARLGIDRYP